MGDFLKPLLNGEYQVAVARRLEKLARLSREETEHETWIQATALALRLPRPISRGPCGGISEVGKSRRSRHGRQQGSHS